MDVFFLQPKTALSGNYLDIYSSWKTAGSIVSSEIWQGSKNNSTAGLFATSKMSASLRPIKVQR